MLKKVKIRDNEGSALPMRIPGRQLRSSCRDAEDRLGIHGTQLRIYIGTEQVLALTKPIAIAVTSLDWPTITTHSNDVIEDLEIRGRARRAGDLAAASSRRSRLLLRGLARRRYGSGGDRRTVRARKLRVIARGRDDKGPAFPDWRICAGKVDPLPAREHPRCCGRHPTGLANVWASCGSDSECGKLEAALCAGGFRARVLHPRSRHGGDLQSDLVLSSCVRTWCCLERSRARDRLAGRRR